MKETIGGYFELRRDVMALADSINDRRREMLEMIHALNQGVTTLVEYADKLFPRAVAEMDSDGEVRQEYRTKAPSPEDIAAFTNPRQRKCSNCGQPGHTARTCTNVRKPEPEEMLAHVEKQEKKKRKPLSPERKAQLAETLKKARAARKRK